MFPVPPATASDLPAVTPPCSPLPGPSGEPDPWLSSGGCTLAPIYSPANSYGVLLLCVLVGLFSLFAMARRPGRRGQAGLWLVCLCLGAAGAVAFLVSPGALAIALAGLGGILALGGLLRAEAPTRLFTSALRPLAWPRFQALLLLAVRLTAGFGWVLWVERDSAPYRGGPRARGGAAEGGPPLLRLPVVASTDQGFQIPLYEPARPEDASPAEPSVHMTHGPFALHLITSTRGRGACNCHGWVFTGGRYWLLGKDLDRILADNGYETVTGPAAGGGVIFRDGGGGTLHSRIVRGRTGEGQVLVESKWGRMGCFIHTPEDQPYAAEWKFYRSPRKGHSLSGTDTPYKPGSTSRRGAPST